MTKEESARLLAVYYVFDSRRIKADERVRRDIVDIYATYGKNDGLTADREVNELFEKYRQQIEGCSPDIPYWVKRMMAEKYKIHI